MSSWNTELGHCCSAGERGSGCGRSEEPSGQCEAAALTQSVLSHLSGAAWSKGECGWPSIAHGLPVRSWWCRGRREEGVSFGNGKVVTALSPFCLAIRSDFSDHRLRAIIPCPVQAKPHLWKLVLFCDSVENCYFSFPLGYILLVYEFSCVILFKCTASLATSVFFRFLGQ